MVKVRANLNSNSKLELDDFEPSSVMKFKISEIKLQISAIHLQISLNVLQISVMNLHKIYSIYLWCAVVCVYILCWWVWHWHRLQLVVFCFGSCQAQVSFTDKYINIVTKCLSWNLVLRVALYPLDFSLVQLCSDNSYVTLPAITTVQVLTVLFRPNTISCMTFSFSAFLCFFCLYSSIAYCLNI